MTNALNGMGYGWNVLFSFCYGFPISLIETFLRTRPKPASEATINFLSVALGSVVGTVVVYTYLIKKEIIPIGEISWELILNFGFGFSISAIAFYFFWSRYRNQSLTLALRDQQLKAAELENLKQQAENRLLQSQMEPHFLFNTLANIQSLIDIDADMAKGMINDLSQMLRASLKNSSQDQCTVNQEMALVRAYLNIQSVRIGDRLTVEETIEVDASHRKIIPMIIQPLLENSIKHGVEQCVGNCTIELSAYVTKQALIIKVEDNCASATSSTPGHGLSLNNIQTRLTNTYGNQAKLISEKTDLGWFTQVTIPFIAAEDPS
jgi:sensor histidine kinase YesM